MSDNNNTPTTYRVYVEFEAMDGSGCSVLLKLPPGAVVTMGGETVSFARPIMPEPVKATYLHDIRDEFWNGVETRILNVCDAAGLRTLEDVASIGRRNFSALRTCGPSCVNNMGEVISRHGLKWARPSEARPV